MKVVVLDFDGVVNGMRWLNEHSDRVTDELRALADAAPGGIVPDYVKGSCSERQTVYSLASIDPAAVSLLNVIVRLTGAKIVVSSTWRMAYTVKGLQWLLDAHGFQGEVVDMTPYSHPRFSCRGDEIQAWLDEHPEVDRFVILDDDADMGHLEEKLVRTERDVGLTEFDAALAVNALGTLSALAPTPLPP